MDEKQFEMAAELEQRHRDAALATHMRQVKPPVDFNGTDCVDCDEPILAPRLALGRWTCVECQTRKEKRNG